mgnify:CR=1 FL=1
MGKVLRCVEVFFFQAEDGIRDAQESRGLGDVYKRQPLRSSRRIWPLRLVPSASISAATPASLSALTARRLSLIHI